jgi:hypothetical protein
MMHTRDRDRENTSHRFVTAKFSNTFCKHILQHVANAEGGLCCESVCRLKGT